jgi:hypothetical protein
MVITEPVNKNTTPRLHNRRTTWDDYRIIIIEEAANLNISLKSPDDINIALTTYIGILQEAAQQATPTPKPQTRSIKIPSEIKELIAEKRRARKVWQQSHAPSDRTA